MHFLQDEVSTLNRRGLIFEEVELLDFVNLDTSILNKGSYFLSENSKESMREHWRTYRL